jgi:hypothetical protein
MSITELPDGRFVRVSQTVYNNEFKKKDDRIPQEYRGRNFTTKKGHLLDGLGRPDGICLIIEPADLPLKVIAQRRGGLTPEESSLLEAALENVPEGL